MHFIGVLGFRGIYIDKPDSLTVAQDNGITFNDPGELAGKRDQFQLGKIEKEAVEWARPLEAGDTMFNVVNTYTRAV